jgi:hypothetical protein
MRGNWLILSCFFLGLKVLYGQQVFVQDQPWIMGLELTLVPNTLQVYQRAGQKIEVLNEGDIQFLVQLGERLSTVRRQGHLELMQGMWDNELVLSELNKLLFYTEEELEQLQSTFFLEYWQTQASNFYQLVDPLVQNYFAQNLEGLAKKPYFWPLNWFERSFFTKEELLRARDELLQWNQLLEQEKEPLALFFSHSSDQMLGIMAGALFSYWLYEPESVWPFYSRLDVVRVMYLLQTGFYEAMYLLRQEKYQAYEQYLLSLPWQEEVVQVQKVLQANMQALEALFYDSNQYGSYIQQRNRLLFENDQSSIQRYERLLKATYSWLLASTEEKEQARQRYERLLEVG